MPSGCAGTNAQHEPAALCFPSSAFPAGTQETATSSPRCFYSLCTVCGRDLPDIPVVVCGACGSHTHISCARDAYSGEWLVADAAAPALTSAFGATSAIAGSSSSSSTGNNATATVTSGATRSKGQSTTRGLPPTREGDAGREQRSTTTSPGRETNTASGAAARADKADPEASGSPASPGCGASLSHPLPSPQVLATAAAKVKKEYDFYCHPDCAMGMEVQQNPQFDPHLSARVEAAFAVDWRRTWQLLAARLGDTVLAEWDDVSQPRPRELKKLQHHQQHLKNTSVLEGEAGAEEDAQQQQQQQQLRKPRVGNSADESLSGGSEHNLSSDTLAASLSVQAQLLLAAKGNATLAQELMRLFGQLRAEAWADYFEQERHHGGHPLFYPPPFLDVQREAAFNHVLEAAAPHGQAARLYGLDPTLYPVGSVVAIPVGVLTRWQQPAVAPLVKINDSNNFVAEAAAMVVGEAVVPQTVSSYANCGVKGRVHASS